MNENRQHKGHGIVTCNSINYEHNKIICNCRMSYFCSYTSIWRLHVCYTMRSILN